jgi:hypothetical protein
LRRELEEIRKEQEESNRSVKEVFRGVNLKQAELD